MTHEKNDMLHLATANLTLHSLIFYILITWDARRIRAAYKNYLSSAVVAFIGTIFNREDTLFPLLSRHNTYLTSIAIFLMGFAGGRANKQRRSQLILRPHGHSVESSSFFLSLSSRYRPPSSDSPVRFLCCTRTVYATGGTIAMEFADLGYWITSDK